MSTHIIAVSAVMETSLSDDLNPKRQPRRNDLDPQIVPRTAFAGSSSPFSKVFRENTDGDDNVTGCASGEKSWDYANRGDSLLWIINLRGIHLQETENEQHRI